MWTYWGFLVTDRYAVTLFPALATGILPRHASNEEAAS